MTELNIDPVPGSKGQTKSTWRNETSLRGVLIRLMKENPEANDEELAVMFIAKGEMSADLVMEALRYAFDNHLAQVRRAGKARPVTTTTSATAETEGAATETQATESQTTESQATGPAAKPARKRVSEADLAAANERLVKIVLLDLVEPNGKKARDCTAGELRGFGGWRIAVADHIGDDNAIVGEKVSEADVAGILATQQKG